MAGSGKEKQGDSLQGLSGKRVVLFSLLPGLLLFLLCEGILRLFGFQYSQMPLEMRYFREGTTRGVIDYNKAHGLTRFKKDKLQHWVPETPFGQGYAKQKPAGTLRIVTLGDSCTAGCAATQDSYPGLLESMLAGALEGEVEVLNAGVGSHSSYQGMRRLEHTVLPFSPDVVTLFYGWNDHWISPIADKDVEIRPDWVLAIWNLAERSRVFQALNSVVARARGIQKQEMKVDLRVSPADYESNLSNMVDMARAAGAEPYLVTAPHDLSEFRPSSIFPGSREQLVRLHRRYNALVRKVGREKGVPVLDLEAWVESLPEGAVLSDDGIHFHPEGCKRVAAFLAEALLSSPNSRSLLRMGDPGSLMATGS